MTCYNYFITNIKGFTMSDKQKEKDLKELTSFSKTSLKSKLSIAIEKNDQDKIDTLFSLAQQHDFDITNHFNTDDYQYHTVLDSIIDRYIKDLKEQDKVQKDLLSIDKKYDADFTFLDFFINKGLKPQTVFPIMDIQKDFFDVLFRKDFINISQKRVNHFYEGLLSRLDLNEMDHSLDRYIKLTKHNVFRKEIKGKRKELHNTELFDSLLSHHRKNNIPLNIQVNDLKNLFYFTEEHSLSVSKENIKFVLESCNTDFYLKNENFEYVIRLLLKINNFDYALQFLEARNVNFNEQMNKKYKPSVYSNLEHIPLMAKLIINPNDKTYNSLYEHPVLKNLSEHFNFKYINTLFSSVFKEEYYLSNNNYYSTNDQELKKMIDKGMDFYSKNTKTGTDIFDYAITHKSSGFFMKYYKNQNGWNVNYENEQGLNLINKLIVNYDLASIKDSKISDLSTHYLIGILREEYKDSFIPDYFIYTLLSYPESFSAKTIFEQLYSYANPEFKDEYGNDIKMAYFRFPLHRHQSVHIPAGYMEMENVVVNNNGECFLHVAFNNPNYNNKTELLYEVILNESSIYQHIDNSGHNPLYYFKKSQGSDLSSHLTFGKLTQIVNHIPADIFFDNKNIQGHSVSEVLLSYSSLKPQESIQFETLIEKKTIEYSLLQGKMLNNLVESSHQEDKVPRNKKRL